MRVLQQSIPAKFMVLSVDLALRAIHSELETMGVRWIVDSEIDNTQVVCVFGGIANFGNWAIVSVVDEESQLVTVTATSQDMVDVDHFKTEIVEFVTLANFGVLNGSFDFDLESGDLRFVSVIPIHVLYSDSFSRAYSNVFQIAHGIFTKYVPGILKVASGEETPKEAILLVEGGKNSPPDPIKFPILAAIAQHFQDSKTNYLCHEASSLFEIQCTINDFAFQVILSVPSDHELRVRVLYPSTNGKVDIPKQHVDSWIEFIFRMNSQIDSGHFVFDETSGILSFLNITCIKHIALETITNILCQEFLVRSIETITRHMHAIQNLLQCTDFDIHSALLLVEHSPIASGVTRSSTSKRENLIEEVHAPLNFPVSEPFLPNEDFRISLPPHELDRGSRTGLISYAMTNGLVATWGSSKMMSISGLHGIDCDMMLHLQPGPLIFEPAPQSIIFNLGNLLICPTHIMVEFSVGVSRSWSVYASCDDVSWDALRTNDSVAEGQQTYELSTRRTTFYSSMKLAVSAGNEPLTLSSIEFYGMVVDLNRSLAPNQQAVSDVEVPFPLLDISDIDYNSNDPEQYVSNDEYGHCFRGNYCGISCSIRTLSLSSLSHDQILAFERAIALISHTQSDRFVSMLGAVPDMVSGHWLVVQGPCSVGRLGSCLGKASFKDMTMKDPTILSQIAKDCAEAIFRLHEAKTIHGNLTANSYFVDNEHRVQLERSVWVGMIPPTDWSPVEANLVSPIYSSPEVIIGSSPVSYASDVFSLGIVIYQLLEKAMPYSTDIPARLLVSRIIHCELRPEFSPESTVSFPVRTLLTQMWNQNPKIRPSAKQVHSKLSLFL